MVLFSLVTYDLAAPIAHITMPTILHFETKFVGLLHLSILADEIENRFLGKHQTASIAP